MTERKSFTRITHSLGFEDGDVATTTIETNSSDLDIDATVQLLRQLLLGVGFHPDNVKEYLGE